MSARVSPSGPMASVMASISSWVSDLSVCRTIGVWAQPMTAISVEGVLISEDPVHEVGVVDIGFAVGDPAEQCAPAPPHAATVVGLLGG